MKNPIHNQRGAALVITLGLLVLVTVLAVSAITIAGYESKFSASRLDTGRAEMIAESALGEVVEKLNRIPLDTHWAASPGRIRYRNGANWSPINLYSEGAGDDVELNIPLTDGSYSIIGPNTEFPTAPSMKVKWMYVLSDGTVTETMPASGVVGRYAYWVDLENARVNINTAGLGMTSLTFDPAKTYYEMLAQNPWATDTVTFSTDATTGTTKPVFSALDPATARANTPQYLTGHPSSVSLASLENVSDQESLNTFRFAGSYFLRVDARHARLDSAGNVIAVAGVPTAAPDTTVRFFSQPEDWQMIVSKDTYQKNKGYLTVKGRTPEINPWGLPKMVLSTTVLDGAETNLYNEQATITRRTWIPAFDSSREDSRPVQVPMFPSTATTVRAAKDYRCSFRDLGMIATPPNSAAAVSEDSLRELFRSLTAILGTAPPGFSAWSDAYPQGDAEQTALGIATLTDSMGSVHTGGSFSLFSYNPFAAGTQGPNDTTIWTSQVSGTYGPIFPSGKRRWAADNELLLNEIIMQAQVVPASARPFATAGANAATPSLGIPYLLSAPQILFFTSKPNTPWPANAQLVSLVPDLEVMAAKSLTACPGYFTWRMNTSRTPWRGYLYDVKVTATGSGGESISGSYNNLTQAASGANPQNGLLVASFSSLTPALATLDTRDPSGNGYAVLSRVATGGNAPDILLGPFAPTSSVTVTLSARFSYARIYPGGSRVNNRMSMSVPGIVDPAAAPAPGQLLTWTFTLPPGGLTQRLSYEVSDPRLGANKAAWVGPGLESVGENVAYTTSAGDKSSLSAPDGRFLFVRSAKKGQPSAGAPTSSNPTAQPIGVDRQTASRILGLPGVGYLSGVATGVETGTPWKTLNFQPAGLTGSAPDWMLWNYFYVPFDRSVENNTDGKMNINAELIPFGIRRTKPLEALIGNRPGGATVAANIAQRTGSPALGNASDMYIYPGQICNVSGVADTGSDKFTKEALVRDLADLVTTQSSDFRVFVVAQALKQLPSGVVKVMAEDRSEATISRSPDTGQRGYPISYLNGTAAEANANPFWVMTRANYQSGGLGATKFNAVLPANITGIGGRSWLGADRLPNTADDWMVPQKVEISSRKKTE